MARTQLCPTSTNAPRNKKKTPRPKPLSNSLSSEHGANTENFWKMRRMGTDSGKDVAKGGLDEPQNHANSTKKKMNPTSRGRGRAPRARRSKSSDSVGVPVPMKATSSIVESKSDPSSSDEDSLTKMGKDDAAFPGFDNFFQILNRLGNSKDGGKHQIQTCKSRESLIQNCKSKESTSRSRNEEGKRANEDDDVKSLKRKGTNKEEEVTTNKLEAKGTNAEKGKIELDEVVLKTLKNYEPRDYYDPAVLEEIAMSKTFPPEDESQGATDACSKDISGTHDTTKTIEENGTLTQVILPPHFSSSNHNKSKFLRKVKPVHSAQVRRANNNEIVLVETSTLHEAPELFFIKTWMLETSEYLHSQINCVRMNSSS